MDADRAVFELYGAHYLSLARLAGLLVGDAAAAEEVVQESFVALHSAWPRLQNDQKALSYLRRSVVSRSRLAQRRGRPSDKSTTYLRAADHGAPTASELPAVIGALRALPVRQREALVLRFYGDLSQAQIAAAMGISIAAARSHTARGLRCLRGAPETES